MSRTWTLVNPATEEPFREVPVTGERELAAIVARAREAQRAWRRVPVEERVRIVSEMVTAFRAMADRVAVEITRQMGKPLQQSYNEINTMIDRAETMCRLAPAALADEPLPPKEGFSRFIRHEPLGVALDIAAWNYPLLIAVMDQVDAGTVFANRCDYLDPMLAWVGVKNSGKGCSLSHLGFRHLTRPKTSTSARGPDRPDAPPGRYRLILLGNSCAALGCAGPRWRWRRLPARGAQGTPSGSFRESPDSRKGLNG